MALVRRLLSFAIHCRVYFLRTAGWITGVNFGMMLWFTLERKGFALPWWQMSLLVVAIMGCMVVAGWLEFRFRTVDIEQEIYAQHTKTFQDIVQKLEAK